MTRDAIGRLLKRAPLVAIFIKGPHAFTFRDHVLPVDYMARKHKQIWFEEFKDVRDKVVYLDNWDMTVGSENVHSHPNVLDMFRNLFAHICDIP